VRPGSSSTYPVELKRVSLRRPGYYTSFTICLPILLYAYLVDVPQSPAFLRFILSGSGWFKGGTCLYIEKSVKDINANESVLLCMHPHG
jgi:hypothetical protein